jgi:hypothetical protein
VEQLKTITMPISKNRKEHKTKVKQLKERQMSEQNKPFEVPEVRNVPVWANDAIIEMKGFEFEALFNGLMQIQTAQQAVNGIMSRNVLNGTVKMDFEKFDKAKQEYVPMSDEEKAPYVKNFEDAVEAAKKPQVAETNAPLIQEAPTQFVTPDGVPVSSEDLIKPEEGQEGKVVKGNFGQKSDEPVTDGVQVSEKVPE